MGKISFMALQEIGVTIKTFYDNAENYTDILCTM